MFGGDDLDRLSLHSGVESVHARPETEKADHRMSAGQLSQSTRTSSRASLASNRHSVNSIISLRERDYGWSSGAGALANARYDAEEQIHRPPIYATRSADSASTLHMNGAPQHRSYRPPFAPSAKFDLHDEADEATDLVPMPVLMNRGGGSDGDVSPRNQAVDLNRGRSFRQKIGDALARATSTKAGSTSAERAAPVPAPAPEDLTPRRTVRKPSHRHNKARDAERAYDPDARQLGHFSSRLADYDDNAVRRLPPNIASIPLYAPPSSAHVPSDTPALSSYAPRPPLRPRSQTVGTEQPKPAQTVGQAARAYSIKRAQTLSARAPRDSLQNGEHSRAKVGAPGRYNSEDRDSRRAARKPKVVPEGWATADQLGAKDAREEQHSDLLAKVDEL